MSGGSIERIGQDLGSVPVASDWYNLDGRLIGMSAKFFVNSDTGKATVGALGFITDSTSCEEATFVNLGSNPFVDMSVDIDTGATAT